MTTHQANQLSNTKNITFLQGTTKNVIAPHANQHDKIIYIKLDQRNTIQYYYNYQYTLLAL